MSLSPALLLTQARAFALALLALAALGSARVDATTLVLTGNAGFSYGSNVAHLFIDGVVNGTSSTSAPARLELWAFNTPYTGGALNGLRLATCDVGVVPAATALAGICGQAVPFTLPPAGSYYMALVLTEFDSASSNDGYKLRDYQGFATRTTFDAADIVPVVGLWWNPAESGSGYALDFDHGVLVVTVYSYKADGSPLWYIVSGPLVAGSFTGTLNRTNGGQCISCTYVQPAVVGNDGVMSITFTSATTATMSLPGGRVIAVTKQAF